MAGTHRGTDARGVADYGLLFLNHPQPMWFYDIKTLAFLDVNDAAVAQYGYTQEEFQAMTINDIRPPEDVPDMLESVAPTTEQLDRSGPWRHLKKDGTPLEVEIISHTVTLADRPARLVMVLDVTQRRKLERQLAQTERLESIGQLAGGVAHDFNNLLSVIINYASFVVEAVPAQPPEGEVEIWRSIEQDVRQIERAAERATQLTHQLLAFARKEAVRPQVLSVNDAVRGVENLLHRTLGEQVNLESRLASDLRPVSIDPGKLEQVLINLAVNARDAMPGGGNLTITTENADVEASAPGEARGVAAGPYVRLRVIDTGQGMDDEVIQRAFEPFFTTKAPGEGTGLGLSTVYGIITQASGGITIDSTPGVGTTFTVLLPEAVGPPATSVKP